MSSEVWLLPNMLTLIGNRSLPGLCLSNLSLPIPLLRLAKITHFLDLEGWGRPVFCVLLTDKHSHLWLWSLRYSSKQHKKCSKTLNDWRELHEKKIGRGCCTDGASVERSSLLVGFIEVPQYPLGSVMALGLIGARLTEKKGNNLETNCQPMVHASAMYIETTEQFTLASANARYLGMCIRCSCCHLRA